MAAHFRSLKAMVMIFAVLIGQAPGPGEAVVFSASAIAAAAATAISTGSSLAGTTIQGIAATGYSVTVAVQVENWTKFPLMYPEPRVGGGVLTTLPRPILPGKREAFAARKTNGPATGSWGTMSWELNGANRRVVIMWSAPYSFDFHSNWLGVGMTSRGNTRVASGNHWFDQMYYRSSSSSLKFVRGEYYYHTNPIMYRDDDFEIVAMMTTIHRAVINVIIRPRLHRQDLLAPSVRTALNHTSH